MIGSASTPPGYRGSSLRPSGTTTITATAFAAPGTEPTAPRPPHSRGARRPPSARADEGRAAMTDAFAPDSPLVARVLPSPNFGERRGHARPDCVVLHYTGMPTAEGALALLATPPPKCRPIISSGRTATIAQLVAEDKRAWHAGVGQWGGVRDLNSASIGDRDRQSRPRRRPAAVSRTRRSTRRSRSCATSRRGARSGPSACSPIPTSRRRASATPASASPGTRWRAPASATGSSRRRSSTGRCSVPAEEGPPVRALQALLALYGYGIELTGVYDAPTRRRRRRLPAPFPPGARRRRGRRFDGGDAEGADRRARAGLKRARLTNLQ